MAAGAEIAPIAVSLRLPAAAGHGGVRARRAAADRQHAQAAWAAIRQPSLARARVRVVAAAEDPEQVYIRRCGAELTLIADCIPVPSSPPLTSRPDAATTERIDAIRAYTAPAIACYELAKLITGLSDGLLALTTADQITDRTILGCPVPDAARSILRAIDKQHHPVIQVAYNTVLEPTDEIQRPGPTADQKQFMAALRWLLRGRGARIPASILAADVRERFDALRADGILERRHREYEASRIALYSSFRDSKAPQVASPRRSAEPGGC